MYVYILSKMPVMQLTFLLPCNVAYLRKGIQDLPDSKQQSGGRGVCSGGKRRGERSSQVSLTQRFKKTKGHITGVLPRGGSVQFRGSHAHCQAQSQPAQHPSAGVGPQVSLQSGLLLRLAATLIFYPYSAFSCLTLSSLFKKEKYKVHSYI